MKRIIIFLSVLLAILMLAGCRNSRAEVGKKLGYEVLRCFDEEDTEALKNLFCDKVRSSPDLDKEIKEAMNFYSGESVSHDSIDVGGGTTVRDGNIVKFDVVPCVRNIITSSDEKYKISIHSYIIYEESKDSVGITYISVYGDDGTKYMIGDLIY